MPKQDIEKKRLIVERKMKEDKQTKEQILSFIVMATYLMCEQSYKLSLTFYIILYYFFKM